MLTVNLKALLERLNDYTALTLEQSVNLCMQKTHREVTIDHWLSELLSNPRSDISLILEQQALVPDSIRFDIHSGIDKLKQGHRGKPSFSVSLFDWMQDAWLIATLEQKVEKIRSSSLLFALIKKHNHYPTHIGNEIFELLPLESLMSHWQADTMESVERDISQLGSNAESPENQSRLGESLQQFCINLTEKARTGQIDPVFGREREIQQMVDILGRRRKNNPILVGDPGVGKTALAEGLALEISKGNVPDFLKNTSILALDLGLLEAGASVKGEYERRLKAVLKEVSAAKFPIILFIDEAHTLIGSGQQQGGLDAANILKPALVRGELCIIAATTWHEYKKYFEKDAALARRFQLIKLQQPDIEDTIRILRGLQPIYEKAHGVSVRSDALEAAAELSTRYISGRQQPDKAIDLIDTAAARVKINLSAKPAEASAMENQIEALEQELGSLSKDKEQGQSIDPKKLRALKQEIKENKARLDAIQNDWEEESALISELLAIREEISKKPKKSSSLQKRQQELINIMGERNISLIEYEVSPELVAKVVSDWTGVPLGKLLKNEYSALLTLEQSLEEQIKGQHEAIEVISQKLKAAKTGLSSVDKPSGVFLLVGPSGVGKTETALAIAERVFGGRQYLTTINMSEFQEKHSVSRLIGSPPGYVGFGEGGMLTEAVRQRSYSVVLLDEVEKASLDVMNLFYQVFDKGSLTDGEGEEVNFKNTVIFLTSNLGSDLILRSDNLSQQQLTKLIWPILSAHFQPALLARMTVVVYRALSRATLKDITRQKLEAFKMQLVRTHAIKLQFKEAIIDYLVDRYNEPELGAREIELTLHAQIMPALAKYILEAMTKNRELNALLLEIVNDEIVIRE
ncbi:type VI secretion system ATPase TssH [Legionella genomosp. 1]|uniref:type VI secretion system ATPase TssH n=1 Tax=Legionella genomosp. 1 TaxID=1093625 RepID=UPI001056571C|nr:type VI secretion system ATPase TssH [Legionella genomosp. 1]